MSINEQAIKAAAHWLFADDTTCEEGCACEMTRISEEHNLIGILNAAMPHIREQIAKEIADFRDNLPQNDSEKWLANEIRKAKAQGWAEGITASGINLDWQLHLLDHNPYTEES